MSDHESQDSIGICADFGGRLRLFRKKLGKSQAEFSGDLKISLSSVTRMERNVFKPQGDFLARLVNVYNCDVASMLTGKEEGEDKEGRVESIVRDQHICDLLKAQRDGLMEILEAITDKENESESVNKLRDKVDYLDALLQVGEGSG